MDIFWNHTSLKIKIDKDNLVLPLASFGLLTCWSEQVMISPWHPNSSEFTLIWHALRLVLESKTYSVVPYYFTLKFVE